MVTSKTLRDTSDFLSSVSKKDEFKPSDLEMVYYLLAKEFGVTLDRVDKLPIPYLMGLIGSFNYIKSEEDKAHKRATKKK